MRPSLERAGRGAPNLFYGTGIPPAIMVFDRDKPHARRGKVPFEPGKNRNFLRDPHIERIADAYRSFDDIEKFASLVDLDEHDPLPWIGYWLGTVLAAYREFESRIGQLSTGHGAKTDIVLSAIDRMIGSFSISELQAACPSVSRDWIKMLLDELRAGSRSPAGDAALDGARRKWGSEPRNGG